MSSGSLTRTPQPERKSSRNSSLKNPGMERMEGEGMLPPIGQAAAPAGPSDFDGVEPVEEVVAEAADVPDGDLLTALRKGDVDAASARLEEEGVRTTGSDADGWTLLHYCCIRDVFCSGAGAALVSKFIDLIPQCIKSTTVMGDLPIHLAALHGLAHVTELLLAAGADKGAVTPFGDTAEKLAQTYGHHTVVEVLQRAPDAPPPESMPEVAPAAAAPPAAPPASPPAAAEAAGAAAQPQFPSPPSEERRHDGAPQRRTDSAASGGAPSPSSISPVPMSPQPPGGKPKGRKNFLKGGLALDQGAIAAVPQKKDGEPQTVLLDDVDVSQITDWLFLGGLKDALKADLLREHNVTRIVQLAPEHACQTHEGFDYLKVQVEDHPDAPIKDHFPPIFEYLDASRRGAGKVFVHCRKGKSRSPTVVIAYFMHTLKIPFALAKDIVKRRRSVVELNLGFTAALEQFESELDIDVAKPMQAYKDIIQDWQMYSPMVDGGKSIDDEDD